MMTQEVTVEKAEYEAVAPATSSVNTTKKKFSLPKFTKPKFTTPNFLKKSKKSALPAVSPAATEEISLENQAVKALEDYVAAKGVFRRNFDKVAAFFLGWNKKAKKWLSFEKTNEVQEAVKSMKEAIASSLEPVKPNNVEGEAAEAAAVNPVDVKATIENLLNALQNRNGVLTANFKRKAVKDAQAPKDQDGKLFVAINAARAKLNP